MGMMKSQVSGAATQMKLNHTQASMAQSLAGVSAAMGKMNEAVDPAKMMQIMKEFERENEQMDLKQEMMDDALDNLFDDDVLEGEADAVTEQVRVVSLRGCVLCHCAGACWPACLEQVQTGACWQVCRGVRQRSRSESFKTLETSDCFRGGRESVCEGEGLRGEAEPRGSGTRPADGRVIVGQAQGCCVWRKGVCEGGKGAWPCARTKA